MTTEEFIEARHRLRLTQTQLAEAMGMSGRSIAEVESGRSPVRTVHVLALERLSLDAAVAARDPMLALPAIRGAALKLAAVLESG